MSADSKTRSNISINRHFPNWFGEILNKIGFFSAIVISDMILSNPFFGGALFICGELVYLYSDILSKRGKEILPHKERRRYIICMPFIALIILSLLLVYPLIVKVERVAYVTFFTLLLFAFLKLITLLFTKLTRFDRRLQTAEDISFALETTPDEIASMMNVSSYKLYWRMTASIKLAFELSVIFVILYLPYLPFKGLWSLLADLLVLVTLYAVASFISNFILKRIHIHELGKNAVFIFFSVIWIIINYYLYGNYDQLSSTYFYIAFMILCIIVSILGSVVISLNGDMQIIGSLGIKDFTTNKFNLLKSLFTHLSTFYSRFVMLVIISFLAFFNELNPYKSSGTLFVMGKYGFTFLPALFLIAGVIAALKHPLTLLYEKKLKKYTSLKKEGKSSKPLEERLRSVLVYQYRKRLGIRILMFLLKPILHHKLIGKENVATSKFPSIFVCNHSQIYGPIAAVLNLPFYVKPWINNKMLDTDKISAHIQQGTFDRQKWLPKRLREKGGKIFGPVIAWAMKSTEPIPVYFNNSRDMLDMISKSVEALEADDNILIFPENPLATDGYVTEGVGEFFSGFVNIARDYYKKTGKSVTFYSIYVNKHKRTLSFSEGRTFDSAAPFKKEKEDITNELHEKMRMMGAVNTQTSTVLKEYT